MYHQKRKKSCHFNYDIMLRYNLWLKWPKKKNQKQNPQNKTNKEILVIKNSPWLENHPFQNWKKYMSYTLLVGMQMAQPLWKKACQFLIKIKHAITIWPSNCTLRVFIPETWKLMLTSKILYTDVHNSFICNSPKTGIISTDVLQQAVHLYHWIEPSNKEKTSHWYM